MVHFNFDFFFRRGYNKPRKTDQRWAEEDVDNTMNASDKLLKHRKAIRRIGVKCTRIAYTGLCIEKEKSRLHKKFRNKALGLIQESNNWPGRNSGLRTLLAIKELRSVLKIMLVESELPYKKAMKQYVNDLAYYGKQIEYNLMIGGADYFVDRRKTIGLGLNWDHNTHGRVTCHLGAQQMRDRYDTTGWFELCPEYDEEEEEVKSYEIQQRRIRAQRKYRRQAQRREGAAQATQERI